MNTKFKFLTGALTCALLLATIFASANSFTSSSSGASVSFSNNAYASQGNPTSVVATVTNDGSSDDTFNLGLSGECPSWAVLSDTQVLVPAGASRQVTVTVTPSILTSVDSCELDLSASSVSNSQIWGSTTLIVIVQEGSQSTGKTHLQTDPVDNKSDSPLGVGPIGSQATYKGHGLGLDFILNPKLETRGYVMSTNDKACVGDTLSLSDSSAYGEWYAKGGPSDSPPIEFVSDLAAVEAKIKEGTYKTTVYRGPICSWRREQEQVEGPKKCFVDASVICSSKCDLSVAGPVETVSSSQFRITGEGNVNIKSDCPTKCIFFVDRPEMTYYPPWPDNDILPQVLPKLYGMMYVDSPGLLTSTTTLNAVVSTRGPDLAVKKVTYPSSVLEDQPLYVKLTVENSGDMEAKIVSVKLNMPNSEILDSPAAITAGATQDILVKADAKDVSELKAEIAYKSDSIGCLNTKDFKETFSLGTIDVVTTKMCNENSECEDIGLTTPFCCRGFCRDAEVGTCDDRNSDGKFEWSYY